MTDWWSNDYVPAQQFSLDGLAAMHETMRKTLDAPRQPDVCVTSVEGYEFMQRQLALLAERILLGPYSRYPSLPERGWTREYSMPSGRRYFCDVASAQLADDLGDRRDWSRAEVEEKWRLLRKKWHD
jgi:hypothetical protein